MQNPGLIKLVARFVLVFVACLIGPFAAVAAAKPGQINVGYFQQWPAPVQFAQSQQTFDAVLGLKVNWVPFASGQQMAEALAAGELQIGYSLGHVPFLVAVNSGAKLSLVGVAVSYPDDDNCILRADAGIDRASATKLAGKVVALRPGSVSHFRMLKVIEHLGVDASTVKILPVADGNAALQALQQGDAVMACAYGTALRRMSTLGMPLMSGEEQDAMGLKLFDTIAVENAFMEQHPDLVQAFMLVNEAANEQWHRNPKPMLRQIARAAQMDRGSASATLGEFRFPLAAVQKSEAWLGGQVQAYTAALAEFFVDFGQLDNKLDSYAPYITARFLR
jgi:taurine transport system substrate-binding protein